MKYTDKVGLVCLLGFLFYVVWVVFSILLACLFGGPLIFVLCPAGLYGIYIICNSILE